MKFTLIYQAPIPPANKATQVEEKHRLREMTNRQLRNLSQLAPLKYYQFLEEPSRPGIVRPFTHEPDPLVDDPNTVPEVVTNVGRFRFAALICQSMGLCAELDIVFYVFGKSSGSLRRDGDLDNRAKTLLDGLSIPKKNQIKGWEPKHGSEDPLFVLLQDDSLVTKLSVSQEPWLEAPQNKDDVLAVVSVTVRAHIGTIYNLGLIG